MSVEDGRRPPRPEPWDTINEPKNNLERLIASAPAAPCTCPSGDGSLRWPCPAHPNAKYGAGRKVTLAQVTSSPDAMRPDVGDRRFWAADLAGTSIAGAANTALPHYDDIAVDHFACAMKIKMAASRAKGRGGWDDPKQCSIESLQAMLLDHVEKGDPIDVANFCMMLWIRDGKTNTAPHVCTQQEEHFAWAAFAENGNAIIWSRRRSEVEPVAAKYGRTVVPLIALDVSKTGATERDWIADAVRDVAELQDRDSPPDWPDVMLVTAEELTDILKARAAATIRPMEAQLGSKLSASQALIALGKYATGYRPGQHGWTPEDDAALAAAMGVSPTTTSEAGLVVIGGKRIGRTHTLAQSIIDAMTPEEKERTSYGHVRDVLDALHRLNRPTAKGAGDL